MSYLQECLESLNATRKLLGLENLYANCDTYASPVLFYNRKKYYPTHCYIYLNLNLSLPKVKNTINQYIFFIYR